jgi:hypothetical protein
VLVEVHVADIALVLQEIHHSCRWLGSHDEEWLTEYSKTGIVATAIGF